MWLFVLFDLPTNTKKERKAASSFRKKLLKDGFSMMQYSIYIRHCPSRENAAVHLRRIRTFLPDRGFVSVLKVTDKQFGDIENFWGKSSTKPKQDPPPQLELF
ncbi:MAG TPA: CRISPR-associated endonuclease Cas2 [Bacteroidetes bacterium]|nr:CRISPR-associated endonuclease Cas2 [Bacteroidota bacterium]